MNLEQLKILSEQNLILNLDSFIISLLISILMSFIVQKFYVKFSTTLSNKEEFSKIFLILGATTTIIITIVKSSLALSLGLVGALSIVRFRAAIKEPEELVYLFLIISIGIGCGAGQLYIVCIGTLIILFLIFFYSKTKSKNNIKNLDKLSISVIYNYSATEKEIENLKNFLSGKSILLKLISLVKTDDSTTINLQIQISNFSKLNNIINTIQKKNIKVIVAQNNLITV